MFARFTESCNKPNMLKFILFITWAVFSVFSRMCHWSSRENFLTSFQARLTENGDSLQGTPKDSPHTPMPPGCDGCDAGGPCLCVSGVLKEVKVEVKNGLISNKMPFSILDINHPKLDTCGCLEESETFTFYKSTMKRALSFIFMMSLLQINIKK